MLIHGATHPTQHQPFPHNQSGPNSHHPHLQEEGGWRGIHPTPYRKAGGKGGGAHMGEASTPRDHHHHRGLSPWVFPMPPARLCSWTTTLQGLMAAGVGSALPFPSPNAPAGRVVVLSLIYLCFSCRVSGGADLPPIWEEVT